jgi:hypothetical protein
MGVAQLLLKVGRPCSEISGYNSYSSNGKNWCSPGPEGAYLCQTVREDSV